MNIFIKRIEKQMLKNFKIKVLQPVLIQNQISMFYSFHVYSTFSWGFLTWIHAISLRFIKIPWSYYPNIAVKLMNIEAKADKTPLKKLSSL